MADFILHHYPMSPFSQKVRGMLGYAGLPWRSVIVREFPPRPALAALAGGYRRIPVAQAGADVFCDSRVIAEEIAQRGNKPELVLASLPEAQQRWVEHVDVKVFFACVLAGGNGTLRRKAMASMSTLDFARFLWDRIKVGSTAKVPVAGLRQARPMVLAHAAELESRLKQDFLFGDTPTHADFSTWHGLWFIRDLAESSMLDKYPRTLAWMDRISAFGEGQPQPMSPAQALAAARASTPRALTDAERQGDPRIGRRVAIAPEDYWQDPTTGTLVGATASRFILAREHADIGLVHVHFPRERFVVHSLKG